MQYDLVGKYRSFSGYDGSGHDCIGNGWRNRLGLYSIVRFVRLHDISIGYFGNCGRRKENGYKWEDVKMKVV